MPMCMYVYMFWDQSIDVHMLLYVLRLKILVLQIWYFMHTNKRISTADQIRWKENGG